MISKQSIKKKGKPSQFRVTGGGFHRNPTDQNESSPVQLQERFTTSLGLT